MAEHIDAIIKIRRGLDGDRRTIVFDQGEIAYSSDIKRVFIGDGTTVGASLVGNLNTIGTSPSPYAVNKDLFYDKNTCIMYMLSNDSGANALVNYARVTPIADGTSITYNNGILSINDTYITNTINTTVTEALTTALPKATSTTLGGIIVGTGLSADTDGKLSVIVGESGGGNGGSSTYTLSAATTSALGGIIVGKGLSADNTGKLSLSAIPETANDGDILTYQNSTSSWVASGGNNSSNGNSALISGTFQELSGKSNVDFINIPSWVKRITIMVSDMSTNGTYYPILRIGTSSGFIITGYKGTNLGLVHDGVVGAEVLSNEFRFNYNDASDGTKDNGIGTLAKINDSIWCWSGNFGQSEFGRMGLCAGSTIIPSGSGILNQIRITTSNVNGTFDDGVVNILWE